MIAGPNWISLTRIVGMIAYLSASVVCIFAFARNRRNARDPWLALCLAILQFALFLDVAFNLRWMLHGFLVNIAVSRDVYDLRRLPQVIALFVTIVLASYGVLIVGRLLRGSNEAILAVSGGIFSILVWLIEVISLDETDLVLHAKFGPVMVIAVVWVISAAATAAGIQWSSRSRGNSVT
jgi:hypothetical protein